MTYTDQFRGRVVGYVRVTDSGHVVVEFTDGSSLGVASSTPLVVLDIADRNRPVDWSTQ